MRQNASICLPMPYYGSLWLPMLPYGSIWLPMFPNGFILIPSCSFWLLLAYFGFFWLLLASYGSLGISIVPLAPLGSIVPYDSQWLSVGPIWVQLIPIQIYSRSRYLCRYRYIWTNISATDTDTFIFILADIWPITCIRPIYADIQADIHVFLQI
jgi:hypothetical protein